jgi:hypothetical protein
VTRRRGRRSVMGDKIKADEMGETCSTYGGDEKMDTIF